MVTKNPDLRGTHLPDEPKKEVTGMSSRVSRILKDALSLPPAERAEIAERLLSSLAPPSQVGIDELWGKEAEERLDAFERGEIRAIPAKQVFKEVGNLLPSTLRTSTCK